MLTLLRIGVVAIGVALMLCLVFASYIKGKDTLAGTIIGIFGIFLLGIVVPISDFFLNYTDSTIAILMAFSIDMALEACYRTRQVKKLKRIIK